MTRHATRPEAAVGFRVKSGWATAVLLLGPTRAPRVADRRVIALSDPAVPQSRQPYHAVMAASAARGAKLETRLRRVVATVTQHSVRALLREYRDAGHRLRGAALVVGSVIDPARIGNDHIRAHALEGRLFRTALEQALRSLGLPSITIVEREAYTTAAARLARPAARLRRAVAELGAALDEPWRAEEKTATVAAWMALRRAR